MNVPMTAAQIDEESPFRAGWADRWRRCARPECGVDFKPLTMSDFHCSPVCAQIQLGRRLGIPALGVQQAQRAAEVREQRAERMRVLRATLPPPAPRSPKPPIPHEGALPPRTKVRYLGGSRAAWLIKGALGVVRRADPASTSLRYYLLFGERTTNLGAECVEPIMGGSDA